MTVYNKNVTAGRNNGRKPPKSYRVGDAVYHAKHGPGAVVAGGDSVVVVRFGTEEKTFVPELAPLTRLEATNDGGGRKRPKGYAPWSPRAKTKALLAQVDQVLVEYRAHLPITVRQVFYRLVGAFGYSKTENAYGNLGDHLVRARRSGRIPFEAIRDDSASEMTHLHFDDEEHFISYVHKLGRNYTQNKLTNQDYALRLHCEAEGMMPQMHAAMRDFSVPVYSCSGFDSLTARRDLARWFHDTYVYEGKTPVMLHLGDYDPSGESIFESLTEDVWQFLTRDAPGLVARHDKNDLFVRVALVEEHVSMFGLPTAPPKKADGRSKKWRGQTCQVEALPPDALREIVVGAVREYIDPEVLEEDREAEVPARRNIAGALPAAGGAA